MNPARRWDELHSAELLWWFDVGLLDRPTVVGFNRIILRQTLTSRKHFGQSPPQVPSSTSVIRA